MNNENNINENNIYGDKNFIINSFLQSYHQGSKQSQLQPKYNYYKIFEPLIKKVLDICNILIIGEDEKIKSYDSKEFNTIFSYILYKDDMLFYLYTKKNLRHKHYATRLLNEAGFKNNINFRFYTSCGQHFAEKIERNIFYYPIVL